MPSWICKIFQFLLGVVAVLVDAAAESIKIIGDAVWDVLESVVTGVGGVLGLDGSTVALLGAGLLAFVFLRQKEKRSDV